MKKSHQWYQLLLAKAFYVLHQTNLCHATWFLIVQKQLAGFPRLQAQDDEQSVENHHAHKSERCDVLILARGGGSLEDLWAFNEEVLAKAIFATTTPIISAIGHETDTTIADFVADKRAPTPSAAAMMATPDRLELLTKLSRLHTHLLQQTQQSLANYQYQLELQI
jgi:exodeoxyribonuclease VII large subunit